MFRDGRIFNLEFFNAKLRHGLLGDMPSATNDDHDPRYYTKDEVNDIVEGNTFDFFLNDTLSGIGAPEYFTMDPTETGEAESTFSDTITGDDFLIDSWATSTSEPTFSALVSGIYSFHIHAETTTGANVGTVRLYWELYRRTHPGGVETLLITSEESNILVGIETEYDIHGSLTTDVVLDATDRLVLKVYANIETSRPTDPLVTLTAEGTTAAHFEVVTTITAFDDRYVQVAGDTMTGPLNISNIISASSINLKPSGNNDDYLSFSTVGGIPTTAIVGGNLWLITAESNAPFISLFEDSDNSMFFGWDGTDTGFVSSTHNIHLLSISNNGNIILTPHGTGIVNIESNVNMGGNGITKIADIETGDGTNEGNFLGTGVSMGTNYIASKNAIPRIIATGNIPEFILHRATGAEANEAFIAHIMQADLYKIQKLDDDLGLGTVLLQWDMTTEDATFPADLTMLGHVLTLGDGTANDVSINFEVDTGTKVINWDNDAGRFDFSDNVLFNDGIEVDGEAVFNNGIDVRGGVITFGSAVIEEAELEILDGATVTTTELNYLDGTTLGLAVANTVLAVGPSKQISGMGNISGDDLDISAGTGDYTSTGTITLTNTTDGLLKLQTTAGSPSARGLFEVFSTSGAVLTGNTGINSTAFFTAPGGGSSLSSMFAINSTVQDYTGGTIFDTIHIGLAGGANTSIDLSGNPAVHTNVTIKGLGFSAFNTGDWTATGGAGNSVITVLGVDVTSVLGGDGKTITGSHAQGINCGIIATANMKGTYDADNTGENCGVKIIVSETLEDASTGDIDSYGLHITVPPSSVHGGGGVLNSWGIYVQQGIVLEEQTAANADVAGRGQIWTKNNAGTTELWFTDDNGNDNQIAYV